MNHAVPLGNVIDLAGALILAALGLWLFRLKPRRRTTRLLAAFALAMGTGFALGNTAIILSATEIFPAFWIVAPIITLLFYAAAVFLVLFSLRVPRPLVAGQRRVLILPVVIVGGVVALFLAAIVSTNPVLLAAWPTAEVLLIFAFAFALLLMPIRAARWAEDPDAEALYRQSVLVAAALTLFGGLRCGMFALQQPAGPTWIFLTFPVLSATLWLRVVSCRDRAGQEATGARDMALFSLAMPLLGLALFAIFGQPLFNSGLSGIVRTLTVLVLAYAILRHQLLGIDVKVRWGVSHTTMAAVFVAVFFIVSEGAQLIFADFAGNEFLGIMAAGALLFALSPIQRFADRIATTAVPDAQDPANMDADERLDVYRDQVEAAWRDGSLSPEERQLLDALRERLHLGSAKAAGVESEVVKEHGGKTRDKLKEEDGS